MNTKTCSVCNQVLALDQFVRNKNRKDGYTSMCKPCNAVRLAKFRAENHDHIIEYGRRWYNKNIEKCRERSRLDRQQTQRLNSAEPPTPPKEKLCPKCGTIKAGTEFWVHAANRDGRSTYCKECLSKAQKSRRLTDPEWAKKKDKERWSKLTDAEKSEMTARAVAWHKAHLIERRAKRIKRHRERMNSDPQYYWQFRIRSAIRLALNGIRKSAPTQVIIGCTFEQLRAHLENQFESWMNWDNYGREEGCWSIDHIVPVSAFDLTDPEQQKLCFHYSNQRPFLHTANRKKATAFTQEDMDALKARVLTG